MSFADYSTTPASNTTIGDTPGTFVGPNMPRDNVRPAIQQLMADGRELRDEMIARGDLAGFIAGGVGAVERTAQAKFRDVVSVKDYGAVGDGVADDTAAVIAAFAAAGGSAVHFPKGTYKVGNLPILGASGVRVLGDSRFTTKLVVKAGTTGSVIYNPNSALSTSGLNHISDLFIDLASLDVTAIDLAGVNTTVVERVRVTGGPDLAGSTGTGFRCAAPIDSGAYTNRISDCDATYCNVGFVAEDAANENTFDNCEAIACDIGFDVENGVDTARIRGGRAEGCLVGLRTGGRETIAEAVRFEANTTADVSFLTGCERPSFKSCFTAASPTTFLNEGNATGLFSRGGTFPQRDREPNTSNPIIAFGRRVYAAAATIVDMTTTAFLGPKTDYAARFYDYVLIRKGVALEWDNPANDNSVIGISVSTGGNLELLAYNRGTGTYGNVSLSENINVRPTGLYYGNDKLLGARQTAVGDAALAAAAPTKAEFDALVGKFNLLLDKLGQSGHGLTADA